MRRYLAVSLTVRRLCMEGNHQFMEKWARHFAQLQHYKFHSQCQSLLALGSSEFRRACALSIFSVSQFATRDWTTREARWTIRTPMSALFFKRFLQRPFQIASIVPSSKALVERVADK